MYKLNLKQQWGGVRMFICTGDESHDNVICSLSDYRLTITTLSMYFSRLIQNMAHKPINTKAKRKQLW